MNKIVSMALGMMAIMGAGIGGYMLLEKKNPEMAKDMQNIANNAKNKATDIMNDMKNWYFSSFLLKSFIVYYIILMKGRENGSSKSKRRIGL